MLNRSGFEMPVRIIVDIIKIFPLITILRDLNLYKAHKDMLLSRY